MKYVNIHDTKTNLSKYLEQITKDKSTFIICNNNKPVAKLSEYNLKKPLKFGLLKGKIKMSEDFDDLPDDFMKHFT